MPAVSQVSDAYSARAGEYIALFGDIDAAHDVDRDAVLAWAKGLTGRIIDVGCGPGQWTNFLFANGIEVEGIDPTWEFIAAARRRFPGIQFRVGRAEQLDASDAGLGGILAWYSLIHTEPDRIDTALAEFARCLHPGGGLALGFFEGSEIAPFDHAVTTAYYWPLDRLTSRVEAQGFTVLETLTRNDPGARRHGFITATRT